MCFSLIQTQADLKKNKNSEHNMMYDLIRFMCDIIGYTHDTHYTSRLLAGYPYKFLII